MYLMQDAPSRFFSKGPYLTICNNLHVLKGCYVVLQRKFKLRIFIIYKCSCLYGKHYITTRLTISLALTCPCSHILLSSCFPVSMLNKANLSLYVQYKARRVVSIFTCDSSTNLNSVFFPMSNFCMIKEKPLL